MINKQAIMNAFMNNFLYSHQAVIEVDDHGMVNVSNCDSIKLKEIKAHRTLPVQFGTITGSLSVGNNTLETLQGCPKHVPGYFECSNTLIKNLKGGPEVVGTHGILNWYEAIFQPAHELQSLEGIATHVGGQVVISYSKNLPLLTLCLIHKEEVKFDADSSNYYPGKGTRETDHMHAKYPFLQDLQHLFNMPEHQGPAGVLRMASAMNELQEQGGWQLNQNISL